MRAVALLLAVALPVAADIVHLKNGGQLEGKVVDDAGDSISLQTRSGAVMQIKKSDVDRVEPKPFEVEAKKPPSEAPRGPVAGETFEDPIHGYRITFPRGWRRATNPKNLTYVGPNEEGYTPKIDVMIVRMEGALADVVAQFKAAVEGLKVDSEGKRDLPSAPDHPAWEVLGTFPHPKQKDFDLVTVQTTVDAGKKQYYLLMAICAKAAFAEHAEEFKLALDSFAITPAAGLTEDQKKAFSMWLTKAAEANAKGKDDDAIEAYKKASEILPTYADLHHNLAVLYLKTKREAEAIQEYQVLTNLRPGNADDHYCLGTLYSKAQKFEDAIRCFKKAIEIDPGHESAWNNLGSMLLAKGDIPGAVTALKRAAELEPTDASPVFNLAQAYETSGQVEAAKEAYQKTLERNPKHDGAKKALERLSKPK